jgi:hypothetical protein
MKFPKFSFTESFTGTDPVPANPDHTLQILFLMINFSGVLPSVLINGSLCRNLLLKVAGVVEVLCAVRSVMQ